MAVATILGAGSQHKRLERFLGRYYFYCFERGVRRDRQWNIFLFSLLHFQAAGESHFGACFCSLVHILLSAKLCLPCILPIMFSYHLKLWFLFFEVMFATSRSLRWEWARPGLLMASNPDREVAAHLGSLQSSSPRTSSSSQRPGSGVSGGILHPAPRFAH
jgi:hypothetical protein